MALTATDTRIPSLQCQLASAYREGETYWYQKAESRG